MYQIFVVNKHKPTDRDVYIGRGSVLGNIFTSKELSKTKAEVQCSSREESVQRHMDYLEQKIGKKIKPFVTN